MSGKRVLNEYESKRLLERYGIKTVRERVVEDLDQAMEFISENGYPAVLKVLSEKITHKSDVGGVITGINSNEELNEAFSSMKEKFPGEKFLIQEMCSGVEVIIGGKLDQAFGHVVMFGLGGIFTEVLKDYSVRICPVTPDDADEMIREIKGYRILEGYRNIPPANVEEIREILLKICTVMERENVVELDLNPVMVEKEAKVVDALIILGESS